MEISDLRKAVADIKVEEMKAMTKELLDKGMDPIRIAEEGIVGGLHDLGQKYEQKKATIPDFIRASKAARECISLIEKALPKKEVKVPKKVIIGTMLSQHNIGRNLVGLFLSMEGFEVIDIGERLTPWDFYEKAEAVGADVIAVSVVFAPAKEKFVELLDILKQMGVRDKYKVIVGGAITNKQWAEEAGADGWVEKAEDAPKLVKAVLKMS
jgi:5-methyltetrahydrofolate--homocysteine methyltransferase